MTPGAKTRSNCKMNGAKKRVGIMGGTFNPPHIGHLLLAEWAREEAGLDEILFIPAGIPYMKEQSGIVDGKRRLDMVALAVKDHPGFQVSDIEVARGGRTYTCDTLQRLCMDNPDTEYFFIMGSDCLFSIEGWFAPERIFASCTVIAAARNASPMGVLEKKKQELTAKFHARILLLQFPEVELSSTMVRARVQQKKSIHYMVPEAVVDYIVENRLYI